MNAMKYKLIAVGTAIALLVSAWGFTMVDRLNGGFRYHQHLEQPSEEDLGPCTRCSGDADLCTHLPIIRIETGGQKIPGKSIHDSEYLTIGYETGDAGETEILVNVETVEEEGTWHHGDDPATIQASALFRVRGNSSRDFSKSSYRIKLVDSENTELNDPQPMLGMTSGDEWALHGPFLDKTLIRNYICMNLAAEIMGYAPNVRFCELVLDGEYQGVYLLMETIDVQEGRVDLTEYQEGNPFTSYIVSIEPHADPERTVDNFTQYTKRIEEDSDLEIRYPSSLALTPELKSYINSDFSEIERILFSYNVSEGNTDYRNLLQVDSFVNYYIFNEFVAINDTFSASTYFTKDVRGKLEIGPVWDYNNAWNNYFYPYESSGFLLSQRGWYAQLMKSEPFVDQVVSRYKSLREGVLSDEYLENYILETIDWLGSAVERNYTVWGYSFDPDQLSFLERRRPIDGDTTTTIYDLNPSSFEEAVDWMLTYIRYRGDWLDHHIDSLYQYCQESRNAPQILR